MMKTRLLSTILAAAMAAALPGVVLGQDETTTPEGEPWDLIGYLAEGELAMVPFGVEATLLLASGMASGSGGCNSFTGSYEIDGALLMFDEEMARTLRLCTGDPQTVEDAWLPLLPDVASWAIEEGTLELSDALGDVILTFQQPAVALNPTELAALVATLSDLQSQIDALDQKVEEQGIDRLRERIVQINRDLREMRSDIEALEARPEPAPETFTAAELVLLEGVPRRIAISCVPLRERLPAGTAAALACSPDTTIVAEMAYYLMDGPDALELFAERMEIHDLEGIDDVPPPGTRGCWDGRPSYAYAGGGYIVAIGCYRDGGKANLRVLQESTACKQLWAGGTRLRRPVSYVAVTGADRNIKKLYDWSMRNRQETQSTGLTLPIERPDAADSPDCPGI